MSFFKDIKMLKDFESCKCVLCAKIYIFFFLGLLRKV